MHTLPFAEARAEGQLRNQELRTFQPKRHKTVRHARRLSTVERPISRAISSLCSILGATEALIATADARGILQLGDKLQVGGPVRLMAGPFAEQLATIPGGFGYCSTFAAGRSRFRRRQITSCRCRELPAKGRRVANLSAVAFGQLPFLVSSWGGRWK